MGETDYKEIFSRNLKKYMELNNKTQSDIINDLGLSSSTVSNWCTGQKLPRMNKIEMLANYFGINKSDLIENNETEQLSPKAERDIQKSLSETLNVLENSQDALMFDGEPLDDETRELLKSSLENSMRLAKKIAKEKYTPKKYKK